MKFQFVSRVKVDRQGNHGIGIGSRESGAAYRKGDGLRVLIQKTRNRPARLLRDQRLFRGRRGQLDVKLIGRLRGDMDNLHQADITRQRAACKQKQQQEEAFHVYP